MPLQKPFSVRNREQTPIFFWLRSPRATRRNVSVPQVVLLRVERLLHKASLRAVQNEPWPRRGGQNA